jgi:hypothetical protein
MDAKVEQLESFRLKLLENVDRLVGGINMYYLRLTFLSIWRVKPHFVSWTTSRSPGILVQYQL